VLTAGRFESAEGFTLSSDRRAATINLKDDTSHDQAEQPTVTLRLVWKRPVGGTYYEGFFLSTDRWKLGESLRPGKNE
jgi:hypothetical protein